MFLRRISSQTFLMAEQTKLELEHAKELGWVEGDPYTAEEIVALHEIHSTLVRDHILNYAPGGAIWQSMLGHVADLSFAPVLRMVDDAFSESPRRQEQEFNELLKRIGAHMAVAISENNAELFHQIHVVLKHRREGKNLADLTPKDLGMKVGPGRKPSRLDLSRVIPLVLIRLTGNRLDGYSLDGERSKEKISRAEFANKVRERTGAKISEFELSRQITRFQFGQFMAEQVIAPKRPKKPN